MTSRDLTKELQYFVYNDPEYGEEYGNLPDAFHLSQSEIDELRNQKYELTQYARQKLKELKEKQEKEND
jgi:methionine-rich copper-binding protein CopC